MNNKDKKIYVVVPVANEEATILELIRRLEALKIPHLECVFVMDSYSKDRTQEILSQEAKSKPWIHLYFYKESKGVVSCYLAGMRHALEHGADWIIEMDAGLSHDPGSIPQFLSRLDEGYDCVFGSRFILGGGMIGLPWYRYALSCYGTILANMVLKTNYRDMTSGFEAFSRQTLERMDLNDFLSINTTHFFQTEMRYYCSRLRIIEIPISYQSSSSNLSFKSVIQSLKVLWQLRQRSLRVLKKA